MKWFDWTLLFILLVALGVSGYYVYTLIPSEKVPLVGDDNDSTHYNFTGESQFYKNMRYPDRRISYSIDSGCEGKKKSDVIEAIGIVSDRTVLEFYPAPSGSLGEISILCSELAPEPETRGHFIAGEGGPSEVINTTLYAVIFSGKVSLYREDKCDEAHVATHEILHALGFDHNSNPDSIMYPTLNCKQKIDDYIIEDINNLYSVEGLPDLVITELNAEKGGSYLDFDVKVMNQGLKPVNSIVSLGVFADGKLVKEFDLGAIEVGTTKIFTVENLKVKRSAQEITFYVDFDNEIDEIFEDNNDMDLRVG